MSIWHSIVRHSVGIACEMLTLWDPYDMPVKTKITGIRSDECGRPVIEVQANNYREVNQFTEGTTPAGNVMEVHTHVGPNKWEIHYEDSDIDFRKFLDQSGIPLVGGG